MRSTNTIALPRAASMNSRRPGDWTLPAAREPPLGERSMSPKWQAARHGLAHGFVSGTSLCVKNRAPRRLSCRVPRHMRTGRDYAILFQTLKLRMILPCASRPVVTMVLVFPSGVTATRELVVIRPLTFVAYE